MYFVKRLDPKSLTDRAEAKKKKNLEFVFRQNFEVLVLYLNTSVFCCFILAQYFGAQHCTPLHSTIMVIITLTS